MTERPASIPLVAEIYEQATDWVVRHREGEMDARARRTFDHWLRTSPEHIRAYLEMSSLWEDTALTAADPGTPAQELVERAAQASNVIALDEHDDPPAHQPPPRPAIAPRATRRFRAPFTAVAALLIVSLGAGALWLAGRGQYATATGEQRSILLADGSIVDLNARSRIRVRYSAHERDLYLISGQALFRVSKDKERPFVVHTGGTAVRAVGTQFDVYQRATGTVVTVIEGRVSVLDAAASTPPTSSPPAELAPPAPVFVSAGEQVTLSAAAPPELKSANVAAATAWTQHRFVFDASALADVADQFNRYNARQIVVADPSLKGYRISGVFSATDPALLLRFLRAQPEIRLEESGTEIRVYKKS